MQKLPNKLKNKEILGKSNKLLKRKKLNQDRIRRKLVKVHQLRRMKMIAIIVLPKKIRKLTRLPHLKIERLFQSQYLKARSKKVLKVTIVVRKKRSQRRQ